MALGEKVFDLSKKAGLLQEEVAEKLVVSQQAVSKWKPAKRKITKFNVLTA